MKDPKPHADVQTRIDQCIADRSRHITDSVLLYQTGYRTCVPEKFRVGDKPVCRWCGRVTPKGRRYWCSEECVNAFRVRADAGFAASQVYGRDQGHCAACGEDTDELRKQFKKDRKPEEYLAQDLSTGKLRGCSSISYMRHIPWISTAPNLDFSEWIDRWGPYARAYPNRFWEVDHIVPVIDGGGCCGLDNLRTLCLKCHRTETADLAARRAKGRRSSQTTRQLDFPYII